jgi:acetylornithine deacetylase
MVRVPSVHGHVSQNDVQDIVRDALKTTGATIDDWVPDWSALHNWEAPLDRQKLYVHLENDPAYRDVLPRLRCVSATIGSGTPHLVINSHVDVVTAAPEEEWESPPYSPRIAGGRLYARGAMDAKGGLAATILAFHDLARTGISRGRVTMLSVPEEETGGNGTLAALHRGYVGDGVIFVEPTDLQVVHRHIGLQIFDVHIVGRPGGVLRRSWGDSAITALGRVLRALEVLEIERTTNAKTAGGYKEDDNPGFINVGAVRGGEWLGTRAAVASLKGVMSVLPGETQQESEDALRAAVTQSCDDLHWFREHPPNVLVPSPGQRGSELDQAHPLVQCLIIGGRESTISSDLPTVRPTRAGTMVCDAKTVQGGGFAPSVVFGPLGGGLHSADEWVDLQSVVRCATVLANGARRYLANSGT